MSGRVIVKEGEVSVPVVKPPFRNVFTRQAPAYPETVCCPGSVPWAGAAPTSPPVAIQPRDAKSAAPSKSWNVKSPVTSGQEQVAGVWVPALVGVDAAMVLAEGGGVLESATNAVPLKLPTIYCVPEPTTPGGPPGFNPICRTHLTSASFPSRASGNMLGYSQTPPTVFIGPNLLV